MLPKSSDPTVQLNKQKIHTVISVYLSRGDAMCLQLAVHSNKEGRRHSEIPQKHGGMGEVAGGKHLRALAYLHWYNQLYLTTRLGKVYGLQNCACSSF